MPDLFVIAGCNGAGKSTFSPSLLPEGLISFDYDRLYLDNYNSLPDSELRHDFAKKQTTEAFESAIEKAITNQENFSYETNFDAHPLYWPKKFKENGYNINLIFFCIEDQEIARHRIQVRTEFKGHFVDNKTIDLKWHAGYKNVNLHYDFFDNILFVDNSKQNEIYTKLLQIEKGTAVVMSEAIPEYFKHRLPQIQKALDK